MTALVEVAQRLESLLRDWKLRGLAELSAGAAHEINTPLAIISGQAQHLLKSEESLERARSLERIINQTHRIHLLINDLMFFARPPQPRRKAFNPVKLIEKVVASLADYALERKVSLDFEEPIERITLHADPILLEMAVIALLRNAMEAAPAGGWARVSLEAAGPEKVALVVGDTGPGLSDAQREHLFDPFYSGRCAGRGAGLGLPKVWRIAQLHEGDIAFESEPGKATRFVLTLPAAIKPARPALARSKNGRHVPSVRRPIKVRSISRKARRRQR